MKVPGSANRILLGCFVCGQSNRCMLHLHEYSHYLYRPAACSSQCCVALFCFVSGLAGIYFLIRMFSLRCAKVIMPSSPENKSQPDRAVKQDDPRVRERDQMSRSWSFDSTEQSRASRTRKSYLGRLDKSQYIPPRTTSFTEQNYHRALSTINPIS